MRNVVVLGSTGSVGKTALEVIETLPDSFRVTGLSARSSVRELAEQARKFRPTWVGMADPDGRARLRELLLGEDIEILSVTELHERMVADPRTDVVLNAIVGAAGLAASLAVIEAGKTLAVANKEPLVAAGQILMETAERTGARILPVDSEHSAIFQALLAGKKEEVRTILLTASGGPFRERPLETYDDITPAQALRHPNWEMGAKITIDSATMMNKALEVIEAVALFGVDPDRVRVLIHPQSVVHSMVEFQDGSVVGQMGKPDMSLPVLYALSYPDRLPYPGLEFRIEDFRELTFSDPDPERYPALELGFVAAREGGLAGAVLNAANERSVAAFLDGDILFPEITRLAAHALSRHERKSDPTLEEILEADQWARLEVEKCLNRT